MSPSRRMADPEELRRTRTALETTRRRASRNRVRRSRRSRTQRTRRVVHGWRKIETRRRNVVSRANVTARARQPAHAGPNVRAPPSLVRLPDRRSLVRRGLRHRIHRIARETSVGLHEWCGQRRFRVLRRGSFSTIQVSRTRRRYSRREENVHTGSSDRGR